jgi:serine/threonine protein kinase
MRALPLSSSKTESSSNRYGCHPYYPMTLARYLTFRRSLVRTMMNTICVDADITSPASITHPFETIIDDPHVESTASSSNKGSGNVSNAEMECTPLTEDEAVRIGAQLCSVLTYCQSNLIVHRG